MRNDHYTGFEFFVENQVKESYFDGTLRLQNRRDHSNPSEVLKTPITRVRETWKHIN